MPRISFIFVLFLFSFVQTNGETKIVSYFGYDSCVEISNATTSLIIETQCGGRVLKYALKNKPNVIYLDPKQKGYKPSSGKLDGYLTGGRFDIGPPKIKPNTSTFWLGKWCIEERTKTSIVIVSEVNHHLGIYLKRHFELAQKGSQVQFSQTIVNVGKTKQRLCNWDRTFAVGGGTAIIPLSVPNRFPKGYIVYGEENTMWYMPELQPTVFQQNNCLYVTGATPPYKKYVIDSDAGWLAYETLDKQLFIKRYKHDVLKRYGEMTAVSMSIWYNNNEMVELEPMGPWEWIDPGNQSVFTEQWFLINVEQDYDLNKIIERT